MRSSSLLAAVLAAAIASLGACSGAPPAPPPPPVAVPAAPVDELAAALSAGDAAWEARADAGRLEEAVTAFRRAAALRAGVPEVELRLARAEALRALSAAEPRQSADGWDKAARAAERALRARAPAFAAAVDRGDELVASSASIELPGAEPLYWLAVGRLRVAQATGPMAVLVAKDVILGLLERVVALDERIDRAGPHRWLGAFRAALPAAAGGGLARARTHFERAAALAPEDPFRPVLEAETLAVLLQDGARFDALLAEVAARNPAAERPLAAEIAAAQRMAATLAARRNVLF
jgi:hypothetical protein